MLREGVKIPMLAIVALAVTVLSWGLGRWWISGGHPALQIGWLAGALLIGMAVNSMIRERRARNRAGR